jgi:hypothetical protein
MHANHLKTGQLQQLQLTLVRPVITTGVTTRPGKYRTIAYDRSTWSLSNNKVPSCRKSPG